MGKASSNKKVARAAGTGGGRTARGTQRPWGFYSLLGIVVVVGLLLVGLSRQQRIDLIKSDPLRKEHPYGPGKNGEPFDHWHMAYGFFICDTYRGPIPDNFQQTGAGIHTHGDGLIHVEPNVAADAGKNATIGRFLTLAGITVTETEIKVPKDSGTPDDIDKKNGDKCGDKTGKVRILLNDKDYIGDPNKIRIEDQQHIVFAFTAETGDLPKLPSLDALAQVKADPNATEPTTTTPTADTTPGETTVPGETTTTVLGSEGPTTTAAPGTTTAPAGATTSAPAATTSTTK